MQNSQDNLLQREYKESSQKYQLTKVQERRLWMTKKGLEKDIFEDTEIGEKRRNYYNIYQLKT